MDEDREELEDSPQDGYMHRCWLCGNFICEVCRTCHFCEDSWVEGAYEDMQAQWDDEPSPYDGTYSEE